MADSKPAVRSETIYKAKIIMNLCLTVPAILISSVLLSIRFRPDLLYAVLTVVISVLCSIFMAVFGLPSTLNSRILSGRTPLPS